jgi:hypothetical protein
MVIGRGRRIEHPQPTFLYYYYENSTGKKVREKRNGEQITGKNSKAGQGLFRSRHFRSSMRNGPILLDPPQI